MHVSAHTLKRTEYISLNNTRNGIDMPITISNHCIVKINETTILSIGGDGFASLTFAKTMYFNHETQDWTLGPEMKVARTQHSCGKVVIEGASVIVVAGGISTENSDSVLTSVELLPEDSTVWIEGKYKA